MSLIDIISDGTYKFTIFGKDIIVQNSQNEIVYHKNSNGYETWYDYDDNGKLIHAKDSDGYETWQEYDVNGNMIHYKESNGHYKDSNGIEEWYDSEGNFITKEKFDRIHNSPCENKIVEIDGKKYKLTEI